MKNVLFVAVALVALSTSAFAGVCPTTPPAPGSKCYPLPGRTAYPGVHYKTTKTPFKVYAAKYYVPPTGAYGTYGQDRDFHLNTFQSN